MDLTIDNIIRDDREAFRMFDDQEILALDIETTALRSWQGNIATYNIADGDGNAAVIHTPGGIMPAGIEALLRKPRTWITHNGTNFDWHWLQSYNMPLPTSHHDTLVGEQVLATTGRADIKKNLDATMKRRLNKSTKGEVDHSGWQNSYLTDEQVMYAAGDVVLLPALFITQLELAEKRGLGRAMQKEQELTPIISQIGHNGVQLDQEAFENLLIAQFERAIEAQERIGAGFNPNSPQQVMRYLNSMNCYPKNTKQGTLNLLEDDFPFVKDVQIMRRAAKRESMYADKMLPIFADEDLIVRSMYWQVGAATARFTCTDPNFQQVPKDMRGMFGSQDPSVRCVSSDFSQIEVRLVAELSQDAELYLAIDSEDIHVNMAQTMFNKAVLTGDERFRGKAGTFTWCFIGGRAGLQEMGALAGVFISDEQADAMILRLNRRFRGVAQWHKTIREAAKRRQVTVELPWEHKRHLFGAKKTPQVICNTMVQGSAAMGIKESLFEANKRGLIPYIGALVHDEIMGTNIPTAYAQDFAEELEEAMIEGMSKVLHTVPIKIETKIGSHWSK